MLSVKTCSFTKQINTHKSNFAGPVLNNVRRFWASSSCRASQSSAI